MRDYEDFTETGFSEMEIEVLQEISNIGVGHAATALSQLLHRRVDMSIPYVEVVNYDKISERLIGSDEAIVSSVLVDTYSVDDPEKMLNFLLIFDDKSSKNVLSILRTGEPPQDLSELDEVSMSIIEETGNILLLHTISAINTFSGTKWFPSAPQQSIDMLGAIIDEIIGRDSGEHTKFLLVECDVFTDEETLKGMILIIPNEGALKLIMTKLYGEDFFEMME
ncbi:MAG: chemotaxis protein CheC [Candidatus Kariarchaeaceae archaeon]|jgi:chemotaxis protein CheC